MVFFKENRLCLIYSLFLSTRWLEFLEHRQPGLMLLSFISLRRKDEWRDGERAWIYVKCVGVCANMRVAWKIGSDPLRSHSADWTVAQQESTWVSRERRNKNRGGGERGFSPHIKLLQHWPAEIPTALFDVDTTPASSSSSIVHQHLASSSQTAELGTICITEFHQSVTERFKVFSNGVQMWYLAIFSFPLLESSWRPEVVTEHSAQFNAVQHKLLTQMDGEDGLE